MSKSGQYRRGVGVMLVNRDGRVFVGARIDNPDDAWQMPQGGIDDGEEPWAAALREVEEETGIAPHLVERVAQCAERMRYDLPENLRGKLWGGKWIGQEQLWFLARFRGHDSDVDIAGQDPEFREWRWVAPDDLPNMIVPFKRDLYRRIVDQFLPYLSP
jgi:putative (di)nucleoside polyphosphate hydrolase